MGLFIFLISHLPLALFFSSFLAKDLISLLIIGTSFFFVKRRVLLKNSLANILRAIVCTLLISLLFFRPMAASSQEPNYLVCPPRLAYFVSSQHETHLDYCSYLSPSCSFFPSGEHCYRILRIRMFLRECYREIHGWWVHGSYFEYRSITGEH